MIRPPKVMIPVLLALSCGAGPALAQVAGISGTPHNLSVSGPGPIRASSETEICKFCHIPHNTVGATALWAQQLSDAQYTTPPIRSGGGSTLAAPQPDGNSRLCLSCHDGTVALGELAGSHDRIQMSERQRLIPGDRGYIGTDLSGSHPISFEIFDYTQGSNRGNADVSLRSIAEMTANTVAPLDAANKVQCTTCHDPHSDQFYQEGLVPRFWIAPTVQEVCISCHVLR